MDDGLKNFLAQGNVEIPLRLFQNYHQLGLSNEDFVVLIQLMAFQKEGVALPDAQRISARTNFSQQAVQRDIEKLLTHHFIALSADNDAYDFTNLFQKLIGSGADDTAAFSSLDNSLDQTGTKKQLYQLFQREFGRLLTPMELQTISEWLKKDKFSPELIVTALGQAVNAQILNLRYIEKILLNWKNSHVQTKAQAQADNLHHRQQFAEMPHGAKLPQTKKSPTIKIPLKKIGE
ncbi:DnaD domain-containing protein [Oenococcus sp.]|uniref:DnaD domain-containing protein n=1 Tax=Oenococcus sp. TaxID=1979414 RepID=UPI0039EC61BC